MADILAAMQSEIRRLEYDLSSDPRYLKLNHLRELVRLYQNERVNGSEIASILSRENAHKNVLKRTRQPKPERELLFAEIDKFLMGKTVPIRTADIFAHLESIGIKIPGENPRNNLSAIIFHANDRYQSHGRQGWTLQFSAPIPSGDPLTPFVNGAENEESKWESF